MGLRHQLNGEAVSLAPMEGVTSFPTRLWLHLASQPAHMTTPFLKVTKEPPKRQELERHAPELGALRGVLPYSVTPQLMASDADNARRAAERLDAGVVELNCGCPAATCVGKSGGSGILRTPDVFARTVENLATALGPGRFAVKMRLGYAAAAEFPALLAHVAAQPLARLTVHGRTRADGYRGRARWDLIQSAAKAALAPTWASGDVLGYETFTALTAAAPDVAGVMIGRGALRNPWVFTELRMGAPVEIVPATLAQALLAFALLHELWLSQPEKLIQRVASGRIGAACGTDAEAWEKLVATLSGLVFGVPAVLTRQGAAEDLPLSPTVAGRLRYLWSHLRTSLIAPLDSFRPKTPAGLFSTLLSFESPLGLRHYPERDELFSPSSGFTPAT